MTVKISGEENYVSRCAIHSRFLLCFLRSSYNTSTSTTFYLYIPFLASIAPFVPLSFHKRISRL